MYGSLSLIWIDLQDADCLRDTQSTAIDTISRRNRLLDKKHCFLLCESSNGLNGWPGPETFNALDRDVSLLGQSSLAPFEIQYMMTLRKTLHEKENNLRGAQRADSFRIVDSQ